MTTIDDLCAHLDRFAPPQLAEEWDNVGLLLGDRSRSATRVMTCLTITGDVVAEAIAEKVELIVAHHPLPFRPLKRITTDTTPGRLLWELAGAGVAVYSPHTAFDSTTNGVNEILGHGLKLQNLEPLVPSKLSSIGGGSGRYGAFPSLLSAADLVTRLCKLLDLPGVKVAGPLQQIERVGIACGSGGSLLEAAIQKQCQAFVTGEATFHTILEAEAAGVTLLLAGHYATERCAVEWLAQDLSRHFPHLQIWASRAERDPLTWVTG